MPKKNVKMPELKMPEFEMPEFEMPEFEMPEDEVAVAEVEVEPKFGGGGSPCHHGHHDDNDCKKAVVNILKELDETQEKFNKLLWILIFKLKCANDHETKQLLILFTHLFNAMCCFQGQIAETIEEACDCEICEKKDHKDCHKDRY